MSKTYNVYCDESCHLENDMQKAMVIGAVWCPRSKARTIAEHIRGLKVQHGLSQGYEAKWTRVQPSRKAFYLSLVNYFFNEDDLHFRALIVPDKSILKPEKYGNTHDSWYYRMYYYMLMAILSPRNKYRIFIDIKDTRGGAKVRELKNVIQNSIDDFDRSIIQCLQIVRSDEIEQVQLADLFTGCVSSINRGCTKSEAKATVANRFREKSGYQLTHTTLMGERKVNIFRWDGRREEK